MRLSRRFLVQYPWTLQAKPLGFVGLLPRICQENATRLSGKCGGFICSVRASVDTDGCFTWDVVVGCRFSNNNNIFFSFFIYIYIYKETFFFVSLRK